MLGVSGLVRTGAMRHQRDETGASAVEYGLLAVAIAAVIVIIVFALGVVVEEMFTNSCTSVQASAGTTVTCG
jgi:pilus assembly protein Flp/PilA